MKKLIGGMAVLLAVGSTMAWADSNPNGLWKTYDLKGNAIDIIKITASGNQLNSRIVKVLPTSGYKDGDRCDKCTGSFKDKPIVGLPGVWGLTKNGDTWEGGKVLDFRTGKIYKCYMKFQGNKAQMTGYVGVPMLGKTVTWDKVG